MTIWDRNVAVHCRLRISDHFLVQNLGLIVAKNWGAIGSDIYDGASVTTKPVELNYFRRGGEFIFPIYLREKNEVPGTGIRMESLAPEFRGFIDSRYDDHFTPEDVLGYIYAILHCSTYRTRYTEFLRGDFPRVPIPEGTQDFEVLSRLGWALVEAHLLRRQTTRQFAKYNGKGHHKVETVKYSQKEQSIRINNVQYFAPVPIGVWDFQVGGYQVLDKYLKSRKGRTLSLDEINHVGAIADSLAFTIAQTAKIDEAYKAAFAERG